MSRTFNTWETPEPSGSVSPPFIITEAEIDQIFDILEETMQEVFAEIGL